MSLEVGDHVHVVSGKKQTGKISVIDLENQTAVVHWGVLDGETFSSTHKLEDLYKSNYVPPKPPETEEQKKAEALKSEDAVVDVNGGYGG